jgi:electron transfer flavoprotein beta subunit
MPAITYATSLSLQEAVLRADRAVEDRTETVEADLPVLATVGMEINTARMPTVLQIMGAGRKPITELTLAELDGVDAEQLERAAPVSVLDVFAPPNARKQIVIKGDSPEEIVTELLRRLGADGEVKF